MKGGKKARRQLRKSVGRAPTWLKTVAVAKPHRRPRVAGSFGAASPVVKIDPQTGLPIQSGAANDTSPQTEAA